MLDIGKSKKKQIGNRLLRICEYWEGSSHPMHLGIWNENRRRNKIWKNNSLSGHVDFFPKSRPKNHRCGHLEMIWDGFGHSKYSVIWAFGQKTNYGRHPISTNTWDQFFLEFLWGTTNWQFDYQLLVGSKPITPWFFVTNYQDKGTVGCSSSIVLGSGTSTAAGCYYHIFSSIIIIRASSVAPY